MQILALAGIMMVNVIILSKIKIKIDDITSELSELFPPPKSIFRIS